MRDNKKCACCGYYTLPYDSLFEICEVCFWEHDEVMEELPNETGGANDISLNEAKKNYAEFGACERRFIKSVRPPKEYEKEKK